MNRKGKSIAMLLVGIVMFSFLPSCGIIQGLQDLENTLEQIQVNKPNYRFYAKGTTEAFSIYAFNIKDNSKTKVDDGNACKRDEDSNTYISGICRIEGIGSALITNNGQTIEAPRMSGITYFKDGSIYVSKSSANFKPEKVYDIPDGYGLYSFSAEDSMGFPVVNMSLKNSSNEYEYVIMNYDNKKTKVFEEKDGFVELIEQMENNKISSFLLKINGNDGNITYQKCDLDFNCNELPKLKNLTPIGHEGVYYQTQKKPIKVYYYDYSNDTSTQVKDENGKEIIPDNYIWGQTIQNNLYTTLTYGDTVTFATISKSVFKKLLTLSKNDYVLAAGDNVDISFMNVINGKFYYYVEVFDSNYKIKKLSVYETSADSQEKNVNSPLISKENSNNKYSWFHVEMMNGYIILFGSDNDNNDFETIYKLDGKLYKDLNVEGDFAYQVFTKIDNNMVYFKSGIYNKKTKKLINYDENFDESNATIDYPSENTDDTGVEGNFDFDFPGTFLFYTGTSDKNDVFTGNISLYAYDKEKGLIKVEEKDNVVVEDENDIPLRWIGGIDN